MNLCASDHFPAGGTSAAREAAALSLLTAVNLFFRQAGAKGCALTGAAIRPHGDGATLTIEAGPGPKPATLDELRALFGKRW